MMVNFCLSVLILPLMPSLIFHRRLQAGTERKGIARANQTSPRNPPPATKKHCSKPSEGNPQNEWLPRNHRNQGSCQPRRHGSPRKKTLISGGTSRRVAIVKSGFHAGRMSARRSFLMLLEGAYLSTIAVCRAARSCRANSRYQ
jgi:hypothetical protein